MTWFKRRSRNRLYRHDLKGLDAKMRTKIRSQRQTRFLGIAAVAAAVVGLLAWGTWLGVQKGMQEMFWENSNYRITAISFESTGETLKAERVLARLRIVKGQNLLAIDIQQIRHDLESLPMVEKAEVSRELPGRLIIRITERVPVANISVTGNDLRYQIDSHAVIMDLSVFQKNPDFKARLESLPNLVGANLFDLKIGRAASSPEIDLALRLIKKTQQIELGVDLDIDSIDVAKHGIITVMTSDHTAIKFNGNDLDRQLRRLAVILDDAHQRGAHIATIDLTVGKDVPVTFASNH